MSDQYNIVGPKLIRLKKKISALMRLKLNKVRNAKNLEVNLFMRYIKQTFIRCMIMQQGLRVCMCVCVLIPFFFFYFAE